MKKALTILLLIITSVLSGCSGGSAAEMFETAQFEELQNNRAHAMQLYENIIKKYPESGYAAKARERLSEMKKD
ncbi:MAG: hypothetical protein C4538_01305 [Nitrospiraceae bacterium]|nr:MAG: hypothetical protein C4538_01305 [Nitrospiraceae bacterium]